MKVTIYSNEDVAKMCGCSTPTAKRFAQNHNIRFLGEGRRKIYIWFQEDIDAFMRRDTKRGRRCHKSMD
jgi:hypothetical protein